MKFLLSNILIRKAGIIFPAFFLSTFCYTQQVALKNYSVGDGLPQSQVFGLHQDRQGYIWMGTKGGGIVKFDGKKFIPLSNDSRILFVNKIKSEFGKIYIAHTSGFSLFDENTGKLIHPINSINDRKEPVSEIIPFTNDSIMVATIKGLYFGTPNSLQKIPFEIREADQVPSCGIYFNHSFYIGNNYGLTKLTYSNKQWNQKVFNRKNGLISTAVRCIEIYNNTFLIGTYGGGIFTLQSSIISPAKIPGINNQQVVQELYTDRKNNLWVATANNGIFRYNPTKEESIHITETEGLCRNNIVSIFEDDWGNIWLGSSGGGVSRYSGQLFIHYTNRTGLEGKNVYSCIQTPDSTIWLGSSAQGITRLKSDEIKQFNKSNGFTDAKVKALYYSTYHDCLFIGTEGDGIWIFKTNSFEKSDELNNYSGQWIKHFFEDENHRLIISTASRGVIVFDKNLHYQYSLNKDNHLPVNRVNQSLVLKNEIWIGTEGNGLVRFDETNHAEQLFNVRNDIPGNTIRSVIKDKLNRIWIGTPSGIGYFENEAKTKFKRVRLPKGFNNSYFLFSDENYVYSGTAQGLIRIHLSNGMKSTIFSANEGFTGIECSQNAISKGLNQSLLIGTINGFTIMRTHFEQINNLAPVLNFTQINLFYENLLSNNNELNKPIFNYTQNHLGFKFIGINQLNPDGVRYQWKLKGLEENWSPLTTTNEVNYTNLDAGDYVFMVKAQNENGIWTSKPLLFEFSITRPWFRQNWFYAATIVGVILILLIVYLLILRRAKKIQERKNTQLQLENRLLEIQQMALRLQMNPHFIFNCLNSIQNLVSQNRNDDANFYIQKFSGLMRGMVDLTPKETIRLDEELNLLSSYIELEKLNRSNSFNFKIETELSDALDFYRVPPLLIQPFAENAIVHAFKGINYTGEILIKITEKQNLIQIEITDNGIGNESELELPKERNSAIKITNQRLDLFNNYKHNWVEIYQNKGGAGLTIRLTVISN